jgi:hypothetical protein
VRNFALFLGTVVIAYLATSVIFGVATFVFTVTGFDPVARLAIAIVGKNGPGAYSLYNFLNALLVVILWILLTWKLYPRYVKRWGSKHIASADVGPIQSRSAAVAGTIPDGGHVSSDPEPAVPDVLPDPR